MKTTRNANVCAVSLLVAMALPTAASAKGVEDLKPGEVQPAEEPAQPEVTPAPEAKPAEPVKPEEPKKEEPKPVERSEQSKSLDGKLFLGTGVGITSLSGSSGSWSGGGVSELMIGVKTPVKVMDRLALWGIGHYQPISGTASIDDVDYRVRVSSYGAGALAKFEIMPNMVATGLGVLAITSTLADVAMARPKADDVEGYGFRMIVGGGAEWTLLEKIQAGPRVMLGLGSFTTFELGATVGFMF